MGNKLLFLGLCGVLLHVSVAKGADTDFDDTLLNIFVDAEKKIDSYISLTTKIEEKQALLKDALERLSAEIKTMPKRMSAEAEAAEERCNQPLSVEVTRLNKKVNELSDQLAKRQDVITPYKRPAERACDKIKNDQRAAGINDTVEIPPYTFHVYKSGTENSEQCRGVLIDKRFVLILADCWSDQYSMQIRLSNSTELKKIKEIHREAIFFKRTTRSDIVLIELDSDVNYSADLYPVCLYTSQSNPKNLVHISKGAEIVENAKCEEEYRTTLEPFEACVKDIANSYTHSGDAIYVEKEGFPNYQLFGMTLMSGSEYKLYLVAKVFDHLDFIERTVWP